MFVLIVYQYIAIYNLFNALNRTLDITCRSAFTSSLRGATMAP